MTSTSFDYIIVGAGSAGCVLANRLTADPGVSVLLLEAGGKDNSVLVRMPAGVGALLSTRTRFNWYFETEGQKNLMNRKLYWPRGKCWGGSSSINGMIYIRGHARDYDQWRQMGLEGWGFGDVLPYFKRAEANENGGDKFHGGDGPLAVSNGHSKVPLFRAYIEAGAQAGFPTTKDFNGFQQEGFGPYQLTIKDGRRWSTAAGYLLPVLSRPNLKTEVNAHTARVLFDGKRAIGVEYVQKGKVTQVMANREVILAGGAVNTPQLLLLSGIGDADYLRKWNVPIVADLPGVGRNLQDHLDITVQYECTQPITFYTFSKPLKQIQTGLAYSLFGQGTGRQQGLESGAFVKTRSGLEIPDLQIHFVAALMMDHGRKKADRHGFTAHACQLRPESRGFIALKSLNPLDAPLIQPNYMSTENDKRTLREGVKILRKVFAQKPFDPFRGPELMPGATVTTDDEIDDFVRRTAETIYHPIGTARMGHDRLAVVDGELKVHGVQGLRVVDASVMPTLVGGNTNAPTIMIAEKASDMILGKPAPPPEPIHVAEDNYDRVAAAR
ncbi:MAG: choline dehydrogenase [Alphaproteobacteria bacterium]|nr:choline dehydrogenase [Alphaproteobacteria bacterium]